MKRSTIRRHLKVNNKTIDAWLAEGCPHKDKDTFDEFELVQWLKDTGRLDGDKKQEAEPVADTICTSIRQASKALGVSESSIRNWLNGSPENDFPGDRDRFPIKAIQAWRETQARGRARGLSNEEKRVQIARARKLEIEVDQKAGRLVPYEEVRRQQSRAAARHVSIMRGFPNKLAKRMSELPGMNKKKVDMVRKLAMEMIEDLQTQISRDLIADADSEDMDLEEA